MFAQVQTRVLNRDRLHPPLRITCRIPSPWTLTLMLAWWACGACAEMSLCENDDGVTALEYFLQSQEAQTQVIDYFDTVYGLFISLWSDASVCSVCWLSDCGLTGCWNCLAALSADDQADDVIMVFVGRADLVFLWWWLLLHSFAAVVCNDTCTWCLRWISRVQWTSYLVKSALISH